MTVKDLQDWPGNFSVIGTGRGVTVPTHASQVTISDIRFALNDSVSFKGIFDGNKECLCRLAVPDRKTASEMAMVLREHKGENLLSLADVELPAL